MIERTPSILRTIANGRCCWASGWCFVKFFNHQDVAEASDHSTCGFPFPRCYSMLLLLGIAVMGACSGFARNTFAQDTESSVEERPDEVAFPRVFEQSFKATDSLLALTTLSEGADADTREMLGGLVWEPGEFAVSCKQPLSWSYDCLVRFPSSISSGDAANDLVAMEWHMARGEDGQLIRAPAVVVVHESGRGMTVGRSFAFLLSRAGLHTFMIQLPGYGQRIDPDQRPQESGVLKRTRQAVADVRRARDAVITLPLVDPNHVALQGTSLGGFVSATAAGMDGKFDSVFIMLAGGNLYDVIANGARDAASLRKKLAAEGLEGDRLKELLAGVEPNRLANRMDPHRTWLFSARKDTVVPLDNAISLAQAAKLESSHHIIMEADHYSGAVFLPTMVLRVRDEIRNCFEISR
jgi:dienelactone hydrolase